MKLSKILSRVVRFLTRPLWKSRARKIAATICGNLPSGERVLDVGCGDMTIGREILQTKDMQWIGVDTMDYHEGNLEFHLYDGNTLPFDRNYVQTVVLSFVLHHCKDPIAILREASRVAEKRLVILEDILQSRSAFQFWLVKVHDYLANVLMEPDMALPYHFKTEQEWIDAFKALGLYMKKIERLKTHPFAFINQTLFVLEKTNS